MVFKKKREILKKDYIWAAVYVAGIGQYGNYPDDYLHDVEICQSFACQNREEMVESVLEKIRMKCQKVFHTIHNYIDTDEMILRKSTIAAHAGEKVLIPINMRDGSVWRWEKAIQNSSSSQNRISINSSGMSPKSGEIESRLMLRTSAIFFKFPVWESGHLFRIE